MTLKCWEDCSVNKALAPKYEDWSLDQQNSCKFWVDGAAGIPM